VRKVTLAVILVLAAAAGAGAVVINHETKSSDATKTPSPSESYFALGDSVAAGIGLEDPSDTSACDRTNQSYPNIVAKELNVNLSNIACSGAASSTGILSSQNVNNLAVNPQLNQLFAAPKRPMLVTLTIGANDIGWSKTISKCYTATCGDLADTSAIADKIVTLGTNLNSILGKIQTNYSSDIPHVIVTNYYQVFPVKGNTCDSLSGITADEINWWRTQQVSLNQVISKVSLAYPFVKVADVDFSGHELCTSDPWVQGLQDRAPYHPTANGQQAITKAILAAQATF